MDMAKVSYWKNFEQNVDWKTEKACAFTGHRLEELPFELDSIGYKNFAKRLETAIDQQIKQGTHIFLCGMAQGTDLLMGELIAEKKKEQHLVLVGACPYPKQAEKWEKSLQNQYIKILNSCDAVYYTAPMYEKGCFHRRNRFMIDHSSSLIAGYDGRKKGGTYYTLTYAKKSGKKVVIVPVLDQIEFTFG